MSKNELVTNEQVTDLLNKSVEIETGELTKLGQNEWIPLMAVCHWLSESFDKGVAQPGEFVLGGQTSLGDTILAVPLAFRLHVALIDSNTSEFKENEYCMMGQEKSAAYTALSNLNPPSGYTIAEGADLFLFLPEHDSFAQIFMKGQLAKDVNTVWSNGRGGKQLKLKTIKQESTKNKRKWFRLNVSTTSDSLVNAQVGNKNIPMDTELYKKFLGQFSNPVKAAAETVADSSTQTIER